MKNYFDYCEALLTNGEYISAHGALRASHKAIYVMNHLGYQFLYDAVREDAKNPGDVVEVLYFNNPVLDKVEVVEVVFM